jgi:hypothetical protein
VCWCGSISWVLFACVRCVHPCTELLLTKLYVCRKIPGRNFRILNLDESLNWRAGMKPEGIVLRCRQTANSAFEFAYFQEIFRPQNFFLVAQNKVKCAPVGVVISVPRPSEICRYDACGRGALMVTNACHVLKIKKTELRGNFWKA